MKRLSVLTITMIEGICTFVYLLDTEADLSSGSLNGAVMPPPRISTGSCKSRMGRETFFVTVNEDKQAACAVCDFCGESEGA